MSGICLLRPSAAIIQYVLQTLILCSIDSSGPVSSLKVGLFLNLFVCCHAQHCQAPKSLLAL
jgi:hypothetical protein